MLLTRECEFLTLKTQTKKEPAFEIAVCLDTRPTSMKNKKSTIQHSHQKRDGVCLPLTNAHKLTTVTSILLS